MEPVAILCCRSIHCRHFQKEIIHLFNGPFSGTTRVSRYQKGNTNLDFIGARDSEWQWHQLGHMQVCTLLQTDNHTSIPPLSFLQAGCRSCRPTNSVKALKAHSVVPLYSQQSLYCRYYCCCWSARAWRACRSWCATCSSRAVSRPASRTTAVARLCTSAARAVT